MYKDWPALAGALSEPLKQLRGAAPETMKGFSSLARAALETKALDKKTKELVALGISVAIRCEPCITFHAEAAVAQGATRDEIGEILGMAIYMGAGPSVMYAASALEAFDQYSQKTNSEAAT
ncbi:MAG: carboxymuconolactone decarboxylase family protein [Hyphomicrobiales bacterium]|nr:MAG: carboxymuconolactone decarboxylase family protein [Hyphomicrobiales bacterium]